MVNLGGHSTRLTAFSTSKSGSFPTSRPMSSASECLICQDRANAHSHYGAISCTSCRWLQASFLGHWNILINGTFFKWRKIMVEDTFHWIDYSTNAILWKIIEWKNKGLLIERMTIHQIFVSHVQNAKLVSLTKFNVSPPSTKLVSP